MMKEERENQGIQSIDMKGRVKRSTNKGQDQGKDLKKAIREKELKRVGMKHQKGCKN